MARIALLVTDAYYPLTMAGAHRIAKMARFLPDTGWTPIVVCREWTASNSAGAYDPALGRETDVCETIRLKDAGLSRQLRARLQRRVENVLWPYKAPIRLMWRMRRIAFELALSRKVDVVWSSFIPGYVHHVASDLALRLGVRWVADFRDLPDQTYVNRHTRRLLATERRICAPAVALTTTTSTLAAQLARRHTAPVHVIENGFDEDDYRSTGNRSQDEFVIAYFGILYAFRDPRPLFQALDLLAGRAAIDLGRVRVRFYGTSMAGIRALAKGFACSAAVEALPRIGRSEMLTLQQGATVLLNLQGREAGGAVPSKLFEYLGARRPILNIPGDKGAGDAVLNRTGAGQTATDVEEIAAVVGAWYSEWKQTGVVRWRGRASEVAFYSRRNQAAILGRVFDEAVSQTAPVNVDHSARLR
jgi:glycosyltransferase involved in cell wall biosynthesis